MIMNARLPRRRRVSRIADCAEVCEERILPSASALVSGAPSIRPVGARAPSSGGSGGTAFLSPSLTPPNATQLPATAVPGLTGSPASVVASLAPLTPAPLLPQTPTGSSLVGLSASMDQTSNPQTGENVSPTSTAGYPTSASNTLNTSGDASSDLGPGVSGLNQALRSVDFDLPFASAIGLAGWSTETALAADFAGRYPAAPFVSLAVLP
jgi:hypothetical protein